MKKFYKLVSREDVPGGFAIHLDGRPVKTPAGAVLCAPTAALADEIVREWAAQEDEIVPDSMPLTQILTTAQDRVSKDRPVMTQAILAYLDTDLLCYRTEEPVPLAEKQAASWNRWLVWFADTYGKALETTTGLAALSQPDTAHRTVADAVAALDDYQFTVLQMVTSLAGSLVLALAFVEGVASAKQLFDAAHVEENYKADIYNEAEHGAAPLQEKKQAAMKRDLVAARIFLDLVKI